LIHLGNIYDIIFYLDIEMHQFIIVHKSLDRLFRLYTKRNSPQLGMPQV